MATETTSLPAARPQAPSRGAGSEARALLAIAIPLAVVSLSEIAMGLTDTILLGGIGESAVAAGGMGGTLFFTVGATLQGALMAAGVLSAQARGGGRAHEAASLYGTALLLGLLLALPAFILFSFIEPILRAIGEAPSLAHDVGVYLGILRWGTPAFVAGIGVMRAMLPAIGQERLLLRVTPAMAVANGLLNYALINGAAGLPALGLRGSALASTVTLWCTVLCLFTLLHASRRRRTLITPPWPDWRRILPMLRVGLPIAGTIAAETSMFSVASLLAGLFGAAAAAAHQIVLAIGTFTFMVPMSIGQAANVRTGLATGAGDPVWVRRAGSVAIALAAGSMAAIGVVLLLLPGPIIHGFLDPHVAGNRRAIGLAATLMAVLALFQVVDGTQAAAIGALRGMGDTRVPMLLALLGYWVVAPALCWALAFRLGWGVLGIWLSLAGGLASVAAMMTGRFLRITGRATV
ncbi:MATE family efflux transporter [Acetobacteraceae bacterium KSS8]|uniref:Multidrug-efflux transporter n=1 Tax=Endosaccharibacter trunci TaxID=2812733 RepID=A0ABT1W3A8_9PROT|nr:MATE family efflux transporter [Acetobacteraceae bacterium KSS8]